MQTASLYKLWFLLLMLGIFPARAPALLAEESKAPGKSDRFPFPIKVDVKAGETEGLPNRVQDPASGMWYALVPGGTYTIGSDQVWDSKEIQVQMSPYYISETCVTRSQLGQRLLKRLLQEGWFDEELRTLIRRLPEEQQADIRLLDFMFTFDTERRSWGDLLDLSPELASAFKDAHDKFFTEPEDSAKYANGEVLTLEEAIKSIRLTPLQRQTLTRVKEQLTTKLKHLPQGQAPYDRASFSNADSYAEWQGINLPTEAQWEVAAGLAAAGKLKVNHMVGDHREFCSDYYAYNYFQRNSGFKDPTGPRRGKWSPTQLEQETEPSRFQFMARLAARGVTVIRGESFSKRDYSRTISITPAVWEQPHRIRLVINPRQN